MLKDIFAIERADDRHGDAGERFVTVGLPEGRFLLVGYTLRGGRVRIMPAREPEPRASFRRVAPRRPTDSHCRAPTSIA
ncbi:MAG: BrnT family toxin [Alphaproteobacteria bacterium]|nr:BrnT family toxin [Alphaproteobacteria bacterium]